MRKVIFIFLSACNIPESEDQYYKRICNTLEMVHIEGTRTCVNPKDSSYINLNPPPPPQSR